MATLVVRIHGHAFPNFNVPRYFMLMLLARLATLYCSGLAGVYREGGEEGGERVKERV